jgi:hypothetical protein
MTMGQIIQAIPDQTDANANNFGLLVFATLAWLAIYRYTAVLPGIQRTGGAHPSKMAKQHQR